MYWDLFYGQCNCLSLWIFMSIWKEGIILLVWSVMFYKCYLDQLCHIFYITTDFYLHQLDRSINILYSFSFVFASHKVFEVLFLDIYSCSLMTSWCIIMYYYEMFLLSLTIIFVLKSISFDINIAISIFLLFI